MGKTAEAESILCLQPFLGAQNQANRFGERSIMNIAGLFNPVWSRSDNLRDPSVYRGDDGVHHLFYSRYSNNDWTRPENWSVARVKTRDFIHYEDDRDISGKGFASPGDLVRYQGQFLLPYQSYPETPTRLCFSRSEDLIHFGDPEFFLEEAAHLPWNKAERVIDPTFVVDGDRLHCFFVGTDRERYKTPTNLVGHAYTEDPSLKRWEITTQEEPLIGACSEAPDGAENVSVFREKDTWIMIYSEGLVEQHLAFITSKDLLHWSGRQAIVLPRQAWMSEKYGAPYVWREDGLWLMILMGENAGHQTTFGLLRSSDGLNWQLLPEKNTNAFSKG